DFPLFNGQISDVAVAPIAKQSFQKANLERFAKVEHTEAVLRDSAPGIAEAAGTFSEPERVRIRIHVDSSEPASGRYGFDIELGVFEARWRLCGRHYRKSPRATPSAAAITSSVRPRLNASRPVCPLSPPCGVTRNR